MAAAPCSTFRDDDDNEEATERGLTPTLGVAVLTATAENFVGAFAPGTCTIRVTILELGVSTGTVSTLVRKAG